MHSSAFSPLMSHTETTWKQAHNACCIFPSQCQKCPHKITVRPLLLSRQIINRKACTHWKQLQKCEYLHNNYSCKWKETRKAQVPDSAPLWNRCSSWQSQGELYLLLVELNPILNGRLKNKHPFLPAKPRLQHGHFHWAAMVCRQCKFNSVTSSLAS